MCKSGSQGNEYYSVTKYGVDNQDISQWNFDVHCASTWQKSQTQDIKKLCFITYSLEHTH